MKICYINTDGESHEYIISNDMAKDSRFNITFNHWCINSTSLVVIFDDYKELEGAPIYILNESDTILYKKDNDNVVIYKDRYDRFCTSFGKKITINNIEELYKEYKEIHMSLKEKNDLLLDENKTLTDEMRGNEIFLNYLVERAIGDIELLLHNYHEIENKYVIGYVKAMPIGKNYRGYLVYEFEVKGNKFQAEWYPSDNYGCYQRCGMLEDDFSGYILFPTNINDEFLCIEYSC